MPKKPIAYAPVYKGREMFAVLIAKERPSRSYSKVEMKRDLADPDLYREFLKVTLEQDFSSDLKVFRKAVYLVLNAIGMSQAAKEMKIPRTTLYRMFWSGGNPNLKYLLKVFEYLGIRLWVVSQDFIYASRTVRFKNEVMDGRDIVPGRTRRIKIRRPEY